MLKLIKYRAEIEKSGGASIHSKAHWYNDDLGQTIDKPLRQPAGKNAYKEGGSFDFLITHKKKTYLYLLADYCGKQEIDCVVQLPLSSFQI